MKVLIIGANGQLGTELQKSCPQNIGITAVDFPEVDLCDSASVYRIVKETAPDYVINAAAYTAVDLAESEPERAALINSEGVRHLAQAVKEQGGRLVHISTDFIFDGQKGTPYLPEDTPSPQSVYGRTKLDGENAVREIFGDQSLIIRTAWLYSVTGNNFVKTILKLMAERDSLNVVDDQIGTPCCASGLAQTVWKAIDKEATGIFHWTDAGVASWYDFAVAIQEEALTLGILEKPIPVNPISSISYPTPAKRPSYSVLDKTAAINELDMVPVHWRVQLRDMLKGL